ncbi:mCG66666, partial [Mus musculus]
DIRSKYWRPVLLDPDGSHAGLDHGLHTLLPRRRGVRKNRPLGFAAQDPSSLRHQEQALEAGCCWTQMGAMQDLTMACTHFFPGEGE